MTLATHVRHRSMRAADQLWRVPARRAAHSDVIELTRAQNLNYDSFGNALLMLAFMSTGEGWNQFMHDYTVAPPYCTDVRHLIA